MGPGLEHRWPLFRLMRAKNGPSLNELKEPGVWDLYLVYEMNEILDMEDDYNTAVEDLQREDAKPRGEKGSK